MTDNPVAGAGVGEGEAEGDGDGVDDVIVSVGVMWTACIGTWACLGVGVGDSVSDGILVGVEVSWTFFDTATCVLVLGENEPSRTA